MRTSCLKFGSAIAGLTAALLAGTAAEAVTRGGKMIYGRYADSLFLDPVLNDANVDIWVMTNLYDTLLSPTQDGQGVQPGLATKWELTDDGKSVVLSLRSNVKFANGAPLTAENVKWSLDRARDPKAGAWNSSLSSIDSIEVKDPGTIVLKLKHPDPTILPALATFNSAILPRKLFEAA